MTDLSARTDIFSTKLSEHFDRLEPVTVKIDERAYRPTDKSAMPGAILVEDTDADSNGNDRHLRWVFPDALTRSSRSLSYSLPEPAQRTTSRGPVGAAITRVLHALVPKAIGAVAGAVAGTVVETWESHRDEGLRTFVPATNHLDLAHASPDPRLFSKVGGSTLLLIPDAFANAQASFGDLRGVALDRIASKYEQRVLAYEHHKLSLTPQQNALALGEHLQRLNIASLDIVGHGRGGLVARELLELIQATDTVKIGRIVCIGTPNFGTPICDPGALNQYLDRCTNLLSFVPLGGIEDAISAILITVQGLLSLADRAVPGLTAMGTSNKRLEQLNAIQLARGRSSMTCIASSIKASAADGIGALALAAALDRVSVAHDGIVPLDSAAGAKLKVDSSLVISDSGAPTHGSFFARADVVDLLLADSRQRGTRSVRNRVPQTGLAEAQPARGFEVSVVHAGMENSRFPIVVGNYERSDLAGVQELLDERLGGRLSAYVSINAYPRKLGDSLFLKNEDEFSRPPGAYIVGMGDDGSLTQEGLAMTVQKAMLRRCLPLFDDPTAAPVVEVGVSSLLVGSVHGRGLTVAHSVFALIDGIERANQALAQFERSGKVKTTRSVRVAALEIVERYADRAERAVNAVRLAPDQLGLDPNVFNYSEVELIHGRGGLPPDVLVDDAYERETRLEMTRYQADPTVALGALGALGTLGAPTNERLELDVSISGADARVDKMRHTIDSRLISVLVEDVRSEGRASTSAAILHDMLIPTEIEQRLNQVGQLSLVVDEWTANLPWELLGADRFQNRTGSRDGEGGGIVRRFVETSNARFETARSGNFRAALIGAGHPVGFNPLAGVAGEISSVAEILGNAEIDVHTVTDTADKELMPQQVLRELFAENRILHIASHGHYDEGARVSEVVLASGIRITADSMAKLRVVPELVFLNCCEVGQIGTNRLAPGLARQLMSIGVRVVVAAGWPIGDDAATAFAKKFYERLTAGYRFADAVQAARFAARDAGDGSPTWAAYQCYGESGFQFERRKSGRSASTTVPASVGEFRRLLDTLKIRASDIGRTQAADVAGELVPLRNDLAAYRDLTAQRYADRADVQRALGEAAKALGMFGWAAAAFSQAKEVKGHNRVSDLDQYAHLLARYTQDREKKLLHQDDLVDEATVEIPYADLFKSARDTLELTIKFEKTRERYGLLGGVYKRWATLCHGNVRHELLTRSLEAYLDGEACQDGEHYGTENVRQLKLLLGDRKGAKAQRDVVDSPFTTTNRLLDERPRQGDFWSMSDDGDQKLTMMLHGSAESLPATAQEMINAYRRAFLHRSSVSERDTVLSHLRDIKDLCGEDHVTAALQNTVDALSEWNPWDLAAAHAAEAAEQHPGDPAVRDHAKPPTTKLGDLKIEMLPAGRGDSLIVSWGPDTDRFRMLIDGGLRSALESGLQRVLKKGSGVDLLVVTHVDSDHVQGATDMVVKNDLAVGDVWFNGTQQLMNLRSIREGLEFDNATVGSSRNRPFNGSAILVSNGRLPLCSFPMAQRSPSCRRTRTASRPLRRSGRPPSPIEVPVERRFRSMISTLLSRMTLRPEAGPVRTPRNLNSPRIHRFLTGPVLAFYSNTRVRRRCSPATRLRGCSTSRFNSY